MNKINSLIIVVVFLFLTLACSSMMKGKSLAEPAVQQFHVQFNDEKYADIYNQADDEFKKSTSEQQLTELLAAVRRKLGTVKNSNQTGWHVNSTPLGTAATMTYDVEFSDGKGAEQFVFHISGDQATLYYYNINSPELITK